eukprot:TRINITY_DN4048_c0_g1_i2.p1 TRINITY_DN4048_c0_g1~~TRINITY_DN4048_c0_g1_i2.p1  ORF type:complete len:370 (-),score=105.37 TRINITY_DN4048_c0_g1_i2:118-1227(-)
MSMRLKSKLLVAKNYVSTKMGLEAFQEPPEITQRKKDLKAAEALYADLELKVTGFTKSLEANYRASVEVSKFLLTFPEEGQTPAQKDAFRNYGDSFVRVNDSDQKWLSELQANVVNPIRSTQDDIRHAKNLRSTYLATALEVDSFQAKVKDLKSKPGPKLTQAEKELEDATRKRDDAAAEFTKLVATIYDRRLVEILQIFNAMIDARKKHADDSLVTLKEIKVVVPEQVEVEKYQSLIKQAQRMTMNLSKPLDLTDLSLAAGDDSRLRTLTESSRLSEYPTQAFPESARESRANSVAIPADEGTIEEKEPVPIKTVKASYQYVPEEDGELGFEEGDTIQVYEMDDSGWWFGECKGNRGLFPQNYTEDIQ